MATLDISTSDKGISEGLLDQGIYVLMGDIDEETVKPVIEWVLYENFVAVKKKAELLLIISSDGGSMEDAFALIDVMNSSSVPIKTVGLGTIASSGLLIFLAGAKGRRFLTPNTSILSHQYDWGSEGKHHELLAVQKEFTLAMKRMINHYRVTTGLSESVIKDKLLPAHDVYLSPNEALALNMCDWISNTATNPIEPVVETPVKKETPKKIPATKTAAKVITKTVTKTPTRTTRKK